MKKNIYVYNVLQINFGDFGFQTKHPGPEPYCLTPWKPWTYFDLYHWIFLCINKFSFIVGKFNKVANLLNTILLTLPREVFFMYLF